MDHFGIGSAIKGMMMMYFQASRRTGRTHSLVESLKDGDRVIFSNVREADRVKRLCKDRGVDVECVTVPPERIDRLHELHKSEGRTLLDHSWVEKYYLRDLEKCSEYIDTIEKGLSSRHGDHRASELRNNAKTPAMGEDPER